MSILYDPKDRGFSEAVSAIDRCQIAMLRELANATDGRLILKGGMAMRVAVGSMRLTKDVDFDRAEGVSTASVQSSVKKALQGAAQSAGLRSPVIDPGKSTETTVRMRLAGTVAQVPVRFVVEVSGRNPVPRPFLRTVSIRPRCPRSKARYWTRSVRLTLSRRNRSCCPTSQHSNAMPSTGRIGTR